MTGSLCMKWGFYIAINRMLDLNMEIRLLTNQHDEIQMEVPEELVIEREYTLKGGKDAWKEEEKVFSVNKDGKQESAPEVIKVKEDKEGNPKSYRLRRKYCEYGSILCESFTEAGKYLGINIPLAGEYKVDDSWAGTH